MFCCEILVLIQLLIYPICLLHGAVSNLIDTHSDPNTSVQPAQFRRNLDEMMDQGTDQMDPHTVYHIKGDVIWALGPKAKHEIMRAQWGRGLKDVDLSELLKLFKKTCIPERNVFNSRAQFFNIRQEDNETLDEYWKRNEFERNANSIESHQKRLSHTNSQQPSMT